MRIARFAALGLAACHGAPTATRGPTSACDDVRWELVGAGSILDPRAGTIGDRPQLAPDGTRADVYQEVYPGVDLTLEAQRRGFSYRFDVAPGSDPSPIRIRYAGARDVTAEPSGRALKIRAGSCSMREHGLRCFQNASGHVREVDCRYDVEAVRKGPSVAFRIGPYDRALPLIIDPFIEWSSYLGGSGYENTNGAVAVDAAGNAYVIGTTYSTDFPTAGGFDTALGGGRDAFVAKVAADGSTLVWSSYLGGSDDEVGSDIAADALGNAYVIGTTYSSDFPSGGGFDTVLDGGQDAFVAKVDAIGSILIWSSYLGGGVYEDGNGIALDGSDNVCVTGRTGSSTFPIVGGFDSTRDGADAFVTKIAATGSALLWSSYLGGTGSETGSGVAADSVGNVYVTGFTTSSTTFPSGGGFDTTGGGGGQPDAFVTKVDTTGASLVWSSYLGGSADDEGTGIDVDGAGNVLLTGWTLSADFPVVSGFDNTFGGGSDAFIAAVKFDGSELSWSSYLGGPNADSGYDVAVDTYGNAYVVGSAQPGFPTPLGFDTTIGFQDAFVARVKAGGGAFSLKWSSFLGGSGVEDGYGIAVDAAANVYVTGYTDSSDFPTMGGFDTIYDDSGEAFVTRIGCAAATCGDGCCGSAETPCGCPTDCAAICGDGCCTDYENPCTCPADACPTAMDGCCAGAETACTEPACAADCGDGCCTAPETECSCPAECTTLCGDGCCSAGETDCALSCPDDCGPVCGDGCCTGTETPCDGGCDECSGSCGDGCCSATENACNCLTDCAGAEVCGDGCCNGVDVPANCPADCPPTCGDGNCDAGETACNCPVDGCLAAFDDGCCQAGEDAFYPECPPECGDFSCTHSENECNCETDDCWAFGWCGNGCCFPPEDGSSCPEDCDTCGDGACDPSEDPCNCALDCVFDVCADGCCGASEDKCGCPTDCTVDVCGDGCCTGVENPCTCATDACVPQVGDGCCSSGVGETACNEAACPASCGDGCCTAPESPCDAGCATECPASCGDGCCTGVENPCTCATDACVPQVGDGCCSSGAGETACNEAACPASCGDGCCTGAENPCTCAADACAPQVGDGCCSSGAGETACNEAACPASCGDGCCSGAESCAACPADCGGCPESASDVVPDADALDQAADDPAAMGHSTSPSGCGCSIGAPQRRVVWSLGGIVGALLAALRRRALRTITHFRRRAKAG